MGGATPLVLEFCPISCEEVGFCSVRLTWQWRIRKLRTVLGHADHLGQINAWEEDFTTSTGYREAAAMAIKLSALKELR